MAEKDLLKVLDMSEDEQDRWCAHNIVERQKWEHLADLAFRLRDEMSINDWVLGVKAVHKKADYDKGANYRLYNNTEIGATFWFMKYAKPIHWIIAALIALEKKC